MINQRHIASCCEAGVNIEWREEDCIYGPEETGWSLQNGMMDHGGAHSYCNIVFCPWCGIKLLLPTEK